MNNIVIYNKQEIHDRLTCSVCLEYFKTPRNLLCGHSFCSECLNIIRITNNVIVCPLCRYKTNLFNLSIEDLPLNSSLISIIDIKDYNIKTKKDKIKLKKSKSVDCLCINSQNNNSKNTYQNKVYYNNPNVNTYDSDDDYIDNQNCCYQ